MKITKEQKGITLIALVITIIVLLILAGAALATLTGNTSIIDNANNAVERYNKSANNDQNVLNQVESLFAKYMGESNNIGDDNDDTPAAQTYTITYNANGGTGTMEQATASTTSTSAFTPPTGESFIEWNTEADGSGTSYEPGASVPSDVTLYAIWAKTVANLQEGDWVLYDTGVSTVGTNGVIPCRVLYNDATRGIQLISKGVVGEITFGIDDNDIDAALPSYNDAIEVLNGTKQQDGVTVGATKYLNTTYAYDARSVGSVPTVENGIFTSKNSETPGPITLTFTYKGSTALNAKGEDTNYITDWNQMGSLGTSNENIQNINDWYWLASRNAYIEERNGRQHCIFGMRCILADGSLSFASDCYLNEESATADNETYSSAFGLRPCFSLKPNIKVITEGGKDGTTEAKAYTLLAQ